MVETAITFEGEPVDKIDFHVARKTLWARCTFANGRVLDVEVQKSDRKGIVEIGKGPE
ncbi:MAG: hypothetical protein ACLP9K_05840 [Nitrososphaerales archaeon]